MHEPALELEDAVDRFGIHPVALAKPQQRHSAMIKGFVLSARKAGVLFDDGDAA